MIESVIEITHLRILLAIVMLGIASYTDVKKREVSDFIWIVFGIIAVLLIFLEPNLGDSLLSIGISLIVAPFVLLIWRLGLFGGGRLFCNYSFICFSTTNYFDRKCHYPIYCSN